MAGRLTLWTVSEKKIQVDRVGKERPWLSVPSQIHGISQRITLDKILMRNYLCTYLDQIKRNGRLGTTGLSRPKNGAHLNCVRLPRQPVKFTVIVLFLHHSSTRQVNKDNKGADTLLSVVCGKIYNKGLDNCSQQELRSRYPTRKLRQV